MVDDRGFGMLYRYWSDAFYQTVSVCCFGQDEWPSQWNMIDCKY